MTSTRHMKENQDPEAIERESPHLTVERFLAFARQRHDGQTSMSGEPYIEHLLRVLENTRAILSRLPDDFLSDNDRLEAELSAIGHDMLEDKKATTDDIRALGGSESLIRRLLALSRLDPKPVYQSWIVGICECGDPVVIIVKIADNTDNNSEPRIAALPPEKRSIRKRYDKAFRALDAALREMVDTFLFVSSRESRPQQTTISPKTRR